MDTVVAQDKTDGPAQAIIAKAVEAHGGKENLRKLRIAKVAYTFKGSFPFLGNPELDVAIEETIEIPHRMKKVTSGKIGGTAGSLSWAVENGKEDYWQVKDGKLSWLKGSKADVKTMQRTYELIEEMDSSSQAASLIDEKEDKNGKLAGVTWKGFAWACFFDRKTGLLAKARHQKFVPPGTSNEINWEAQFSDYKEVEGVKLFTKMVGYSDGKKIYELSVKDVKLFKKLDDKDFAPPEK